MRDVTIESAGMRRPGEDTRLRSAHALLQAGRADKADSLVKRMLHYRPDDPAALHLAGLIARARGRTIRAAQLLEKAALASPNAPDIWCDYGLALKTAGKVEDSVAAQRRVVAMLPASAPALANLGSACVAAGAFDEGLRHLTAAAALAPRDAEILYNLGHAYMRAGDWAAAEAAFEDALAIAPEHGRALLNLGGARKEQGRLDEAVEALHRARRMMPQSADAEWNLGLALLMRGDWGEGWPLYEARRQLPGFAIRGVRKAPWDGTAPAGRRLLVHAEQGLGDTIQFCRYLPLIEAAGGEVTFLCPPALMSLMEGVAGDATLVSADGPTPRYDVEAPLMSLPHLLRRPVPSGWPYLAARPALVDRWRARIAAGDALTVAIAWQGNPDYPADSRRSVPLARFAPLAEIAGVRLVSLQKGVGEEQLDAQPWRDRVLAPGAMLDDGGGFLDTGAVLAAADLLITSDTAVAHLAGALGTETWLALAHVPDWRWGTAGETTPWYDSFRLFRQEAPGDWDGVFARMAAALERRAGVIRA